MTFQDIAFTPLLPWPLLLALGLLALLPAAIALVKGMRGGLLRLLLALTVFIAASGPSLLQEQREPLSDIALIAVDQSPSMTLADRQGQRQTMASTLKERLSRLPNLEVREVAFGEGKEETLLRDALARAAADIPPGRLAGTMVITDGQVHDVPAVAPDKPFHLLIAGKKNERDRRIVIEEAPNYGIVGGRIWVRFKVIDKAMPEGSRVRVTVESGEDAPRTVSARVGQSRRVMVPIERAGTIPVRLSVEPAKGDLTPVNDRVAFTVNGVRDRLRVLLLSGQPHPGERTWRDLFKSDPAVDLVHFTILRPPEKSDFTPLDELALIQFPVTELFEKQIDKFDLVVFDRFLVRFVIMTDHLAAIVRMVTDKGKAVLVAAGPDFSGPRSLAATPIGTLLPAQPDGKIWEGRIRPQPTGIGRKHPITANLAEPGLAGWGPWLRHLGGKVSRGQALLETEDGNPLLLIDRVGNGRVALLLSDQIWLWARGYQGGGPHLPLLRGLAHWLMKEPDLEEERLMAKIAEGRLTVERRTLESTNTPATVTRPDGKTETLQLAEIRETLLSGQTDAVDLGLYKVEQDALSAWAVSGNPNAPEWREVTATSGKLGPAAKQSQGGVFWNAANEMPAARTVRPGVSAAGSGWLGLRANEQYRVTGLAERPFFGTLLGGLGVLLTAMALLIAAWIKESRPA